MNTGPNGSFTEQTLRDSLVAFANEKKLSGTGSRKIGSASTVRSRLSRSSSRT